MVIPYDQFTDSLRFDPLGGRVYNGFARISSKNLYLAYEYGKYFLMIKRVVFWLERTALPAVQELMGIKPYPRTVAEAAPKIDDALAKAEAFISKHAWYAAKEMDSFTGHDSGIGDEPLVYARKAAGLAQNAATGSFMDMVGNSLNVVKQAVFLVAEYESRSDLVQALAKLRVEDFMDYSDYDELQRKDPDRVISDNQSNKYMLSRMAFDKFVEELGGYALKLDVQREAVRIVQAEGIELSR